MPKQTHPRKGGVLKLLTKNIKYVRNAKGWMVACHAAHSAIQPSKMLLLSGLFFVTVFPLVKAVALFTALQTLPLVPPTPALSGWTPRPTTPSEPELVRGLLIRG